MNKLLILLTLLFGGCAIYIIKVEPKECKEIIIKELPPQLPYQPPMWDEFNPKLPYYPDTTEWWNKIDTINYYRLY